MRRLRYSVIAGAATLLGGIYFREKYIMKSYMLPSDDKVRQLLGRSTILEDNENKPFDSVAGTSHNVTSLDAISLNENNSDHKSRFFRFGKPKPGSLCVRKGYALFYDHRTKIPSCVFEHISASNRQFNYSSYHAKKEYSEDSSVPDLFRSTNSDYKSSHFEKGHMARAQHHRENQEAWWETCFLTNITPQIPKFNRGIWRRLEQYVKHFVNSYRNVYVCSGPLFIPKKDPDGRLLVIYEVIGENYVAVPTHFFKVIIGETEDGKFDMESYVIEHTEHNAVKEDLKVFLVDKSYIEKHAGFLIFQDLPTSELRKVNLKKIKTEKTNRLNPRL